MVRLHRHAAARLTPATIFNAAFPDARWQIDALYAFGDVVARHQHFEGTHQGDYMGVAPTGRRVRAGETGIVRFQDGRMAEFWGVFDDAGILRQLGAL